MTPDVIEMVSPLPGFENCRRYVLMTAPDIAPFARIQGLDGSKPSFLALPPQAVVAGFDQTLDAADRGRLGAADGEPLLWLAIVRVDPHGPNGGDRAFANLRAPLVINPRRMLGLQVISADEQLSISHPLLQD
jgi:flagellar assembly factor FliW